MEHNRDTIRRCGHTKVSAIIRTMFLLPNNKKIDEDGVIDAMLDRDVSLLYVLDTKTGEVGCMEIEKQKKHLDPKRYIEIPKVSPALQLKWMEESLQMIEDRAVAEAVQKEMQKSGPDILTLCENILSQDERVWIYGWQEWQGTAAFEEMQKWFGTLPFEIEEKFEGCGDCELCKLMEQGEHNLGDFLEASAKEKRKRR